MSDVRLKINDMDVTVPEGTTILEAAVKCGFDIPTLCNAKGLHPFTSCFVCAVKIEGGKGNLVPSCATKVREGMVVTVEGGEVDRARKMCINLLVSDHCGDCMPPCQSTCPAEIPIRDFMELVAEGKEAEAAVKIREKTPFAGVLGRICPRPCETECRRNRVDEPMAICQMKRYIADCEKKAHGGPQLPEPAPATGKKVAIIGAGPAGMAAAYYLLLAGHAVTVFEAHGKSGGMLRYGIPFYRLPDHILAGEFDAVEKLGAEVRYNTVIGKDIPIKELERDYDALLIATGAQGSSSMRIEGEELPGVYSGIEILRRVAEGEKVDLGRKTIIIGGGNTAIDAARTAVRLGSEAIILYRRSRAEMPASSFEIDEALEEGVQIAYLNAPLAVRSSGNGLVLSCTGMELGEPDSSGRRGTSPVKGSEYELECSSVIAAIGQRVITGYLDDLGVEITKRGTIRVNPETLMTTRPGIFAAGDCQSGADIAVRAAAAGRKAAYSVNQYLAGEKVTGEPVLFNSSMGSLDEVPAELFEGKEKAARVKMPVLDRETRESSFDEIETGFSEADARAEAERCLRCGCDKAHDCRLRDYATRYGADAHLFRGERRGYSRDESHEDIRLETGKCISCGSCVRACAEIKGLTVLSFDGRGFRTRMRAPFGHSLVDTRCDGCGECVKVCPTGAMMLKKG